MRTHNEPLEYAVDIAMGCMLHNTSKLGASLCLSGPTGNMVAKLVATAAQACEILRVASAGGVEGYGEITL